MNLEVLRPVWETLARDERVRLTFTTDDETRVRPTLEQEGLHDRLCGRAEVTWRRFDLAMNADPWNIVALRRCWRRINLFHGVAGKYDLDNPARLARAVDFSIYDAVLFPNDDRRRRYVDAGVVPPERATVIGFPKVDALVNGAWSATTVRLGLGIDPARPTIIYAPTYSPASSLHVAGEQIIDTLLNSGFNVIVKLHDFSLLPHAKYTAGEDWPARLVRFDTRPGYTFARGAHAGPYLAAADLMITDHSTIGFEFALLDRPLVIFDVPGLLRSARINPDKWAQLHGMGDVVNSVDDVPATVRRALEAPDRYSRPRRTASAALFPYAGHATQRALRIVFEMLELDDARV